MKKIIALSALMAALASANAMAVDSNLTFTGSVTSSTCTMNAADTTKTLTIPDISSAALVALGGYSYSSQTSSTTVGFTSCPASVSSVNVVQVTSTGTQFTDANSYAPASGTATGIHLVISAGNATTGYMPADGSVISNKKFAVTSGSVSIPLIVGVRANKSSVASAAAPGTGSYSSGYTVTFSWS